MSDERRRVEPARLDQRQHAVDMRDHVGEAEPQGQPLQPGETDRDLALAGVGADTRHGAGVADEADRHRQRARVADRVDDDVDPAPAGRGPHCPLRVLLGEVQRDGAEPGGHLEPRRHGVDREDLGRAGSARGLDRAEANRAEAEDGDGVAGPRSGVLDRVEARSHHVAGE